jgi:hypothetical protein
MATRAGNRTSSSDESCKRVKHERESGRSILHEDAHTQNKSTPQKWTGFLLTAFVCVCVSFGAELHAWLIGMLQFLDSVNTAILAKSGRNTQAGLHSSWFVLSTFPFFNFKQFRRQSACSGGLRSLLTTTGCVDSINTAILVKSGRKTPAGLRSSQFVLLTFLLVNSTQFHRQFAGLLNTTGRADCALLVGEKPTFWTCWIVASALFSSLALALLSSLLPKLRSITSIERFGRCVRLRTVKTTY